MFSELDVKCFSEILIEVKKRSERNLIPNTVKLLEILIVNPCTTDRSFFSQENGRLFFHGIFFWVNEQNQNSVLFGDGTQSLFILITSPST